MADGEGRLIDCKNIVFFLTSNLGYQVIVEYADNPETLHDALYPVLGRLLQTRTLLARMEVVPYLPLSRETLATIIAAFGTIWTIKGTRFNAEVVTASAVTDETCSASPALRTAHECWNPLLTARCCRRCRYCCCRKWRQTR